MMRLFIVLLLFISVIAGGCKKDSLCNCLESTGGRVSETRSVDAFTSIEMSQNVDVILKSGPLPQVTVTAGKNLIDGIKTKVENGRLNISNVNRCNWLRDFENKFTVEVIYQDLRFITTRGSGNLNCADTLRSSEFQVDSWNGSGVLDFVLNCREVRFKLHTGPADINASGFTSTMYIYTAGNGYVRAGAVESEFAYVTTKSTGDCEINALNTIDAIIEYQGDVFYKGNPPVILTEITGRGRLIQLQ